MKKILIFKVPQMQKWMAPLERAGNTDQQGRMKRLKAATVFIWDI